MKAHVDFNACWKFSFGFDDFLNFKVYCVNGKFLKVELKNKEKSKKCIVSYYVELDFAVEGYIILKIRG